MPIDVEVREEMGQSGIRLGPVRLLPWIIVRNFGYNNNIFGSSQDAVGDWTATLAAGARLYVPIGSKSFLRVDALPEYTWYQKFSDRNQLGGRGQVAYLGFFNRLSVQLAGTYTENTSAILSSEVPARVVETSWDGKANFEIEATHRISIFAGAEIVRERIGTGGTVPLDFVDVANYDRTDGAARAGVRYHFSPGWDVSLGVEGTQTRFVLTPELRDNRSYAPLFGLHYDRPRFFANLYAGYRVGRPLDGSEFPGFETPTGSAYLSYSLTRSVDLSVFGSRRLNYGSSVETPYYIESRYGGGVSLKVLSRLSVQGYASTGTDDYSFATRVSSGIPGRRDDVSAYGGGLSLGLGKVTVTGGATRTDYNANLAGKDRSVTIFTTGLSFGAEYVR